MTQPEDPYGTPAEHPTPPSAPQPPSYGQPPASGQSPDQGQPPATYGQPPAYGQPPPGYGQPPQGYGYAPPAASGQFGSWIERVGAYIVDMLVAIPGYLVALIGTAIGGGFGALLVIVGYLGALAIFVWNRWIRMGTTGQSVGKQVLNLKLIRESDGQPMGTGMAFVRDIAHFLDGLPCYIGYLWPLWDNKRQTFADKVCSSVVVKT